MVQRQRLLSFAADAPVKPGEGKLDLSKMEVRVDPRAEWRQMFHEIWQIERSFFYDPHYHGVDTVAEETKYEPYLDEVGSRSDLNYLFQEMLGDFSIGHLRGAGGTIPHPNQVPGGLLGADYEIVNGRYRISTHLHRRALESTGACAAGGAGSESGGGRFHSRHRRKGPEGLG